MTRAPASTVKNDVRVEQAPFAITVATMSLVAIVVASQGYVTIPLMPQIGAAWTVSQASATWATSVFAISYACSSLLSGPLSDHYGRRLILAASIAAMAVATALVPISTDLVAGSILRALQGAMAGVFAPVAYAYLGERVPLQRLSLSLTMVSCSLSGAIVIGQVAAQLLESTLGWRSVFWFTTPLLALAAAATWRVMLPDTSHNLPPSKTMIHAVISVLRCTQLLPLYATALTILSGLTAIYTGLQLYGPAELIGDANAMLALRASALPAMLAAVLLAPMLSRISAIVRAAVALAIAAIGMLGAALLANTVTGLATALFVVVFGISTAGPAIVQAIGSGAGTARATGIAIYGFILSLGAGVGAQLPLALEGFPDLALLLTIILGIGTALTVIAVRLSREHVVSSRPAKEFTES